MTTIKFTAKIVGGPHDGLFLDFEGDGDPKEVMEKMRTNKVRLESHGINYRVSEFNSDNMTAVLIYESTRGN